MKGICGLFLGALATAMALPWPAAAEGCLGPVPVAGQVMALDPKTGQAKEVYRVPGACLAPPAVAAGVLYVGRPYQLDAVKLQGGKVLWTFAADYIVYDIRPTPQAVFCGAGSTLHAVDPATGKEIWRFQSHGAIDRMLLSDGMVLFGSHQGVRAVDEQTGKPRWLLPGPLGWDELSLGGKGNLAKAVDMTYRALEDSSAARAAALNNPQMKITDMKDRLREGDVAAVLPNNSVTQFMGAADRHNIRYGWGGGSMGTPACHSTAPSPLPANQITGAGHSALWAVQGDQGRTHATQRAMVSAAGQINKPGNG